MKATYTYDFDTAPAISYVRLLIPDTSFIPNSSPPVMIFSDQEINAFFQIQQLSGFQSSMFFSGSQGRFLPSQPVSFYRVAALALDTLANNKAKLGSVLKILDVTLQKIKDVSDALRDGAKSYRELDDDSGAFMIIEQTPTDWAFAQRWWNQFQRQTAGSGFSS
jgi:hypothetical protein